MKLPRTGVAALALSALTLAVSACGGDGGGQSDAKEFTYWSMYKQDEVRAKILQDAAAAFTKDTGIKANIVFQGRENLKKLQPTLVGGQVPADLVDGATFSVLNLLQATGNAKDLSGVYKQQVTGEQQTVGDVIPDGYETLVTDKGAKYMVPAWVHTWQIFYNEKNLPEVAKQAPATFDELLTLLDKRKAEGKAPLALDGDILGYVSKWVSTLMIRELGPGGFAKVITDPSGAGFDDPKVLKAAEYAEKVGKGGYFVEGWDASKFPAIQQKWAQGQADLLFIGTYGPSETAEIAGKDFTYRSFPFPKTEAGNDSQETTLFGFAVPSKAKNAENAEKFIAYFMNKKWLERIPAEDKILSVRKDTGTPEALKDAKQALDSASSVHLALDGVSKMGDWETKIFNALSKDLISGKLTGKDFVAKLKTDTVEWWKANG